MAADTCDSSVLTCENKDPNWCHVSSVIYKFNIKGKITRSENNKLFHKNKLLHMCKCNCNNSMADLSSVPCFSASLLSPLLSLHVAAALQFAVKHTNTNHIRTYKWMWRDCSCCPAASLAAAPHHWLYWLLYCTLIYILWECHRKGAAPLSTRYIKIMMSTSNWIVNIIGVQRHCWVILFQSYIKRCKQKTQLLSYLYGEVCPVRWVFFSTILLKTQTVLSTMRFNFLLCF